MKSYELPFARIVKLDDSTAEIIVKDGLELTSDMVNDFHSCLTENFSAPIGVIVNKKNRYTYSFNAQMILANIPEIYGIAVIAYTDVSKRTTEAFLQIPGKSELNLKIFDDRTSAKVWLDSALKEVRVKASGVV